MLPELKEESYLIVEETIERTGLTRNSVIFIGNMAGLLVIIAHIFIIITILTLIIATIMNLIK